MAGWRKTVAMSEPRAQRTLVKSPPELWAEVSDVQSLARHLGEFGEIRITRMEPETTVAWEGDRVRGTVHLEPSGWGTKVTLTAELDEPAPEPEAATPEPPAPEAEPLPTAAEPLPTESLPAAEPEANAPEPPAAEVEPLPAEPLLAAEPLPTAAEPLPTEPLPVAEPEAKVGFFARLFRRRPKPAASEPEPVAVEPEPERVAPEPEPVAPEPEPVAAEPEPEPVAPEPEPVASEPAAPALDGERAEAILAGVLDDLGAAHHRPFSRG
jgi:hypothetical protein